MRTLPTLMLLLLTGAGISTYPDRMTLNCRIDPLQIDTLRPGTVWDLRNAERMEDNDDDFPEASYMMYGDTLLSETVDGERRWYTVASDTFLLAREESYGYSYIPDSILLTFSFNNGKDIVFADYRSMGEESHSNVSVREGRYVSRPGVPGKMLIPTGDTLDVSVTVERCEYMSRLLYRADTDTLPGDCDSIARSFRDSVSSPLRVVYRRYRWFGSTVLPIAVQTEVCTTDEKGGVSLTETSAYCLDFDSYSWEMPSGLDPNGGIDNPLAGFTVELNSGRIVVTPGGDRELPTGSLEIDVVSAGGIPYYSRIYEFDGDPVSIPCHTFPDGRYIVGLRYESFIEKRMINIE